MRPPAEKKPIFRGAPNEAPRRHVTGDAASGLRAGAGSGGRGGGRGAGPRDCAGASLKERRKEAVRAAHSACAGPNWVPYACMWCCACALNFILSDLRAEGGGAPACRKEADFSGCS